MARKYDFRKIEPEILDYWEKNDIYKKAKQKGKGKKKFYFLDGPPYTSGRVHIGTAWNKSLKDMVLRYKRMAGFDVWDRAGYDMHGMPTELAVEKKLGLKKEDIPKFGIQKFTDECEKFSVENMLLMNKDFKRMGVWMDFEDPYKPITKEYIEGEWWLIKRAYENKRLYEGEKTMTWCASCGTALAKHELEYKNITDDSIFVKFKVKGKDNEFLIIWTTTPWTIPFNLGVMVNPELDYVRISVEDEIWIVAKGLVGVFMNSVVGKKFSILEEFKGSELKDVEYIHPFNDMIDDYKELAKSSRIHRVVMSEEFVNLSAGSGLVHMAPGCGPEDYEVGYREGIPPYNTLDEKGVFPESMGKFAGLRAKVDDAKFIEALRDVNALIETTKVEHDYAHCWRCKSPVVFRTTRQWFFKVEDIKERMRELNKDFTWVPDYAGSKNFDTWISNLRDNGITRQRYWGTPIPIWKCDSCGNVKVIGSIAELEKESINGVPENLHKPWIDNVKLKCSCGAEMLRIPDILDVWVDSGTASWNCLKFPQTTKYFDELFPADFILEGYDQIRGWFNLLFVASMVSMDQPSFKTVYMHGFVQDALGRKMSKSLGNYILPEEVIEKYGADTLRYYTIGGANPGADLNYNFDDMNVKHRHLIVLWNIHNYLIDYARSLGINPEEIKLSDIQLGVEEEYILSRMNSTIKRVTRSMNRYYLNEPPLMIEELFLDLSRNYIQFVREKASLGTDIEKRTVCYTIYKVLKSVISMFAIVAPMISEAIYLNLKDAFSLEEQSIHLVSWPKYDDGMIDSGLEKSMAEVSLLIQAALRAREKSGLGIRWPVKEITVITNNNNLESAIKRLEKIIKLQLNVKNITIKDSDIEGVKLSVKADHSKIGSDFGELTPKIIAKLSTESPETILGHIEREGMHKLKVNGSEVNIVKEHIIVQKEIPDNLEASDFRYGTVYLNKERNYDLDAEGISRELMRRVQNLRKKAGLSKTDIIDLKIRCNHDLKGMFMNYESQIKEKVGASNIKFLGSEAESDYDNHSKEKVKGYEFEIMF